MSDNLVLFIKTGSLFFVTAVAEIIGCYLPYLYFREHKTPLLLIPGFFSLFLFTWLLTLHPTAAGRTYAAYGGVYITVAILWLMLVERITPTKWDIIGVIFSLVGMAIIVLAPKNQAI